MGNKKEITINSYFAVKLLMAFLILIGILLFFKVFLSFISNNPFAAVLLILSLLFLVKDGVYMVYKSILK